MYQLADTLLRHDVNAAVHGRVRSHPDSFAKFSTTINDPQFKEVLKAAVLDPMGADARKLMTTVLPFITLSGSKVPWGSQERRQEFGKLLALQLVSGAGNNWMSIAPNTVHDPNAIRFSHAFVGENKFPATTTEGFLKQLRARDVFQEWESGQLESPRVCKCDEESLQSLAAKNPVATTLFFSRLVENVMKHLLGLPRRDMKKSSPLELGNRGQILIPKDRKGILGVLMAITFVIEQNKRCVQPE